MFTLSFPLSVSLCGQQNDLCLSISLSNASISILIKLRTVPGEANTTGFVWSSRKSCSISTKLIFSWPKKTRVWQRQRQEREKERGREGCVVLFLIEIDCQVTAQEGGGGRGAEAESGTSGGCSSNPSALGALLISIARTPRKLHLIRRTPKYCQTHTH